MLMMCFVVERPLRRRCQLAVHRRQRAGPAAVEACQHLWRRSFQLPPVNDAVARRVTGAELDTVDRHHRWWTTRQRRTCEQSVVGHTAEECGGLRGRVVGDRRQVLADIRALSGSDRSDVTPPHRRRRRPLTVHVRGTYDVIAWSGVSGPGHVMNVAAILRLMTGYEARRCREWRVTRVRQNVVVQHTDVSVKNSAHTVNRPRKTQ